MGLGMILLIVLVLALLGVIPTWPHSRQWGYYPSGGLGLVLLIIVILLLLGRKHILLSLTRTMQTLTATEYWTGRKKALEQNL